MKTYIIIGMVIVLFLLNIPIFKLIYSYSLENKEGAKESFKYLFTPDLFSFIKGEYAKDRAAELRIYLFLFLCFIIIAVEFIIGEAIIEKITPFISQ